MNEYTLFHNNHHKYKSRLRESTRACTMPFTQRTASSSKRRVKEFYFNPSQQKATEQDINFVIIIIIIVIIHHFGGIRYRVSNNDSVSDSFIHSGQSGFNHFIHANQTRDTFMIIITIIIHIFIIIKNNIIKEEFIRIVTTLILRHARRFCPSCLSRPLVVIVGLTIGCRCAFPL